MSKSYTRPYGRERDVNLKIRDTKIVAEMTTVSGENREKGRPGEGCFSLHILLYTFLMYTEVPRCLVSPRAPPLLAADGRFSDLSLFRYNSMLYM